MIVTPKLLPLPFGLAIITWLLGHWAVMFQVALIRSGEGTFIVTVQLLQPETDTFRLYRSLHCCPADSDAVQLPPPPLLGGVVGGLLVGGGGFVPPLEAPLRVLRTEV